MNYQDSIDYLFTSLPMYQRLGAAAYKNNLDNTYALDEHFNHPHRSYKCIHVAGTNGKGSVSHMLASVLNKSGYKTGLYTSPHLKDFRERIRINGIMISEKEVIDFVHENQDFMEKLQPSFFEMTVAMAFNYFKKEKVDVAVIETGMGGRLDSTNIIDPVLSLITNIGLDHTRFLGKDIPSIAEEKAGIIKPGRPVVISEWQKDTFKVFEKFAGRNKSELFYADKKYHVDYSMTSADRKRIMNVYLEDKIAYENLITDLPGDYQLKNILAVLQSIDILRNEGMTIPTEAIYEGLSEVKKSTGLRGRWDEIGHNPLIICDTAHNAAGVKEITDQLRNTPYRRLHIVWGMVSDKDAEPILSLLPNDAVYYFTKADIPRALDEQELAMKAAKFGLYGKTFSDVNSAFSEARKKADEEDMIFVGGSTFVVGEIV